MPKTTTVTVQENKTNGQKILYIPKALADALGWGQGTKVRFDILSAKALKIEKVEEAK